MFLRKTKKIQIQRDKYIHSLTKSEKLIRRDAILVLMSFVNSSMLKIIHLKIFSFLLILFNSKIRYNKPEDNNSIKLYHVARFKPSFHKYSFSTIYFKLFDLFLFATIIFLMIKLLFKIISLIFLPNSRETFSTHQCQLYIIILDYFFLLISAITYSYSCFWFSCVKVTRILFTTYMDFLQSKNLYLFYKIKITKNKKIK